MHLNRILYWLILSSIFINSVLSIEPITLGVFTVAGIASYFLAKKDEDGNSGARQVFDKVRNSNYLEFCTASNIPYDIDGLKKDLHENLLGQHIVNATLIPALRSHVNNLNRSQKPLVMSFHGLMGTGKNFVADMIVKNFYAAGDKSKFVYKYYGPAHFPLESEVDFYRVKLKDQVTSAVKSCLRSIFIFDEIEKMPAGVFESIVSLLDHRTHVDGVDFRKSIFIFLTNSGGVEIATALSKIMNNGRYREQTELHDFEKIAERAAFNVEGGLRSTSLITSGLIDHFIPFLPLERRHIVNCVEAEFRKLGRTPTEDQIKSIVDHMTYEGLFAKSGCKRLDKKVAVMVEDW